MKKAIIQLETLTCPSCIRANWRCDNKDGVSSTFFKRKRVIKKTRVLNRTISYFIGFIVSI